MSDAPLVHLYPPDVFTPYDHQGKREEITENTVAYHHYMVSWGYPQVHPAVDLRNRLGDLDGKKVLNIGLGSGKSLLGQQLPCLRFTRIDNVEIHAPYIEVARQVFWVGKEVNFFLDDVRQFPDSDLASYDLVLAFDVLEHLEKEQALRIMRACRHMLIFLPIEETPRCHRDGTDDIPSQDHLSTWTPKELDAMGFEVEVFPEFHYDKDGVWPAMFCKK